MRRLAAALALIVLPASAFAEEVPDLVQAPAADIGYTLGGAAQMEARIPAATQPESETPQHGIVRFPDRVPSTLVGKWQDAATMGELSVFGGEDREDGEDVLRLGTALTRGRTTTGLSLTYADATTATRSEVFVDYALTDAFSVGVSGLVVDEGAQTADPMPGLGVSAAYALESGTYVQGGVAGVPESGPTFGVALGFRF